MDAGSGLQKENLFTRWISMLHLPWFYALAADLKAGNQKLEIRVSPEKNTQSKGNACRIRYFYVNK